MWPHCVTLSAVQPLQRLHGVLSATAPRVVACSGGVDSLLLATVAHRAAPDATIVAHAVTAAVPPKATERVTQVADDEGWTLEIVTPGEFADEQYLSNPTDRCYHCKSHLYDAIAPRPGWYVLSGANRDDLGEYRPGLTAAAEHHVRHPFVEADMGKAEIRAVARDLGLDFAELPASPCLASRLYTGTRVTEARLWAVDAGEELIRSITGTAVVRCRRRADEVVVEVPAEDRHLVTPDVLASVLETMQAIDPDVAKARLDDRPYRPGQAVLSLQ